MSYSPSFRRDVPALFFCSEHWNSLRLVLFVRRSGRIPPPTHSWLRNVLWLPSQGSTHFITSLSPTRSSFFLFSLTPSLHVGPHHILCPALIASLFSSSPARLFREAVRKRGDESVGAKAHKLLAASTKRCCGDGITYGQTGFAHFVFSAPFLFLFPLCVAASCSSQCCSPLSLLYCQYMFTFLGRMMNGILTPATCYKSYRDKVLYRTKTQVTLKIFVFEWNKESIYKLSCKRSAPSTICVINPSFTGM